MPGQEQAVPVMGVGQVRIQLQRAVEFPFRRCPLPRIPVHASQGQMSFRERIVDGQRLLRR